MKVYRKSDRLKIQVDDLVFTIRPLTYHEKVEIQQEAFKGSESFESGMNAGYLALKYGVVSVDGLENQDGTKFQYSGTEDDLDALLNLGKTSDKLIATCFNLIQGIPEKFKDLHGKPIAGVKYVGESTGKKK